MLCMLLSSVVFLFLGFSFSDVCFEPRRPSEHSRHWFFRGRMEIERQEQKETLFSLIMDTQQHSNQNNVIKFCDNSRWERKQHSVCVCVFLFTLTRYEMCVCLVVSKGWSWSVFTQEIHLKPARMRPDAH